MGINYYRGSENNVLKRVLDAGLKYKVNYALRITADCPIIDPNIISEIIKI